MSGRETATIETLTASVKTLVVGARQVTLTIFKQLDVVDVSEMIPFGRVNPNGDGGPDWVTVVGKRKITGELVRATAPMTVGAILQASGTAHKQREADKALRTSRDMAVSAASYRQVGDDDRAAELGAFADELAADAAQNIADVQTAVAPFVEAVPALRELPLIVLAGLS
jgi:hypothetical protein